MLWVHPVTECEGSTRTSLRPAHFIIRRVKVKVSQSCPTLCDPMDYTVHGILQARILEWVAFPFSRRSSQPRDRTQVSCIAGRFFASRATREAQENWSGWPFPSPGDLPIPGIEPGSPALGANSLPTELPGKLHRKRGFGNRGTPLLGSLGRPSHRGLFCRVPLLGQLLLWSARARTASARQEPLRLADLPQGTCGRAVFPPCHLPRSQAAGWHPAAADGQLWPGKETQQVTHGLLQPLPRRRSRDVRPPEFTLPPVDSAEWVLLAPILDMGRLRLRG